MKKNKLTKVFPAIFFLTLGLTFISCSNGSGAPDDSVSKTSKEIYLASSSSSDYIKKTLSLIKNSSYTKNCSASRQIAPDAFIVSGSESANLSDDQLRLAILTCLQGKSLIFDYPKIDDLVKFKTRVDTFLAKEENAHLKAECELHKYSPYDFIDKIEHTKDSFQLTSKNEHPYDAIATRKDDVYIVYDVDLPFEVSEKTNDKSNKITMEQGWQGDENISYDQSSHESYEHLISDSAEKFASWFSNSESLDATTRSLDTQAYRLLQDNVKQASNSSIELQMTAQVERRNYTVAFNHEKTSYYDGRYNGKRKEIVELVTYVWTACDIAAQKDYYLIKTSATCNNSQLNWNSEWSGRYPYSPPHLDFYEIDMELEAQAGKADQASPQTTTGVTTLTSGITTNLNFSGGLTPGFSASGPSLSGSGTVSTGISFSESSTMSIPDVDITYTNVSDRRQKWKFSTPDVWSKDKGIFKYDMSYSGPRPIQTRDAVFDTYVLYTIPSGDDTLDRDHIKLKIYTTTQLKILCGQYSKHHYEYSEWICHSGTSKFFDIHIKKPCNKCETYVMGFTPPYELNSVEFAALDSSLKEKCAEQDRKLWIGSASYYGVVGNKDSDKQKKSIMDSIAKSQFTLAKNKILNNKSVFHDAGFNGKYTFYIQKSDTDRQDSFEVDFSN